MTFLYPPRPSKKISSSLIPFYEKRGWVAQIKMNGTGSVASVRRGGHVDFYTRHGEEHRAWNPHPAVAGFFSNFPESVFAFELLHSKGPDVKDTAYVHDVLVWLGDDQVGRTFEERQDLLGSVTPMTDKVIIASNFRHHLKGLFQSLRDPLQEGLVLKDPKARLRDCRTEGTNDSWQVKARRETSLYTF